jgi:predicted nucleotidyltransferase
MNEIEKHLNTVLARLQQKFGDRLVFLSLQGSYARSEAGPDSDVDLMCVLDVLNVDDFAVFQQIRSEFPSPELSFSFTASCGEIARWDPAELKRSLLGTMPIYGNLKDIAPECSDAELRACAKRHVITVYRAICHDILELPEEKRSAALIQCYKQTFTVMQMRYYLETGTAVLPQTELLKLLKPGDAAVLARSLEFRRGAPCRYSEDFNRLFTWCKSLLKIPLFLQR